MTEPVKFTIEQWCDQEHDLLDEFVLDWIKKNIDNPDEWPGKLTAGEWDEQFLIWHNDCTKETPEET